MKRSEEMLDRLECAEDSDIDVGVGSLFSPKDMPLMLSAEVQEVSPLQMKDRFLVFNVYEKQRAHIPRREAELLTKMKDGRYHGGEIAIAHLSFDYEGTDGKVTRTLLMNGQHCCRAAIRSKSPQTVIVKHFKVDRPEQLPVLYAQFDVPGGQRTPSQIALSYTSLPEFAGWNKRQIQQISSAICLGKLGGYNRQAIISQRTDDRIALMLKPSVFPVAEAIRSVVYSEPIARHLDRNPVIAVMYTTLSVSLSSGQRFWESVRTGAGLSLDDPAYRLREWLTNVVFGNTSAKGKKNAGNDDAVHRCLQAWNAFASGQKMKRWGRQPHHFPDVRKPA